MKTDETKMCPQHPRWQEFLDLLAGPAGCHFREEEREDVNGETKTVTCWDCDGRTFSKARCILAEQMGFEQDNEFILRSLAYFAEKGADCDCEIVLNAEAWT